MKNIKIVVTGASGFVGSELILSLQSEFQIIPCYSPRDALHQSNNPDLTNVDALNLLLEKSDSDVIIHLAGNKNINFCEDPANRNEVDKINIGVTKTIVDYSKKSGTHLIYLSTDYVFSGKIGNYREDDLTEPMTYYGYTKLKSEEYIQNNLENYTIIRSGGIYGKGGKFFDWVFETLSSGKEIHAFNDTYFTPTCIYDVIESMKIIIKRKIKGIIHVAGLNKVTRFDMIQNIADLYNLDKTLIKPDSVKGSGLLIPYDNSLNSEKSQEILGIKFLNLRDGLRKLNG